MEWGPILRSMFRKKVKVGLLVVEIAIALAVVVNCLGMVFDNRARLLIPSGLDEENILAITVQPFGEAFEDDAYLRQVIDQDLALLRVQPGVRGAIPISTWPLQGGGSSTQLKVEGADDATLVRTPQYTVDEHFLTTMGLSLHEGRAFEASDLPPPPVEGETPPQNPPRNIIVTKALGGALFPDGDALGSVITGSGRGSLLTIVGIVDYMFTPYDNGATGMEYRIVFYAGKPGGQSRIQYLLRAEAAAFDDLFTDLEERLASVDGNRVITTQSLLEIKERGQYINLFVVRVLTAIIVLLLFVTSVGVFGMTSFAVAERTRQIGTRRALGARKIDIVRLFLVENGIIALSGVALGLVLAFAINIGLVSSSDGVSPLTAGLVLASVALLWGVGAFSALVPALQAARVPPAVASRGL